jgi:hypothetical protein
LGGAAFQRCDKAFPFGPGFSLRGASPELQYSVQLLRAFAGSHNDFFSKLSVRNSGGSALAWRKKVPALNCRDFIEISLQEDLRSATLLFIVFLVLTLAALFLRLLSGLATLLSALPALLPLSALSGLAALLAELTALLTLLSTLTVLVPIVCHEIHSFSSSTRPSAPARFFGIGCLVAAKHCRVGSELKRKCLTQKFLHQGFTRIVIFAEVPLRSSSRFCRAGTPSHRPGKLSSTPGLC